MRSPILLLIKPPSHATQSCHPVFSRVFIPVFPGVFPPVLSAIFSPKFHPVSCLAFSSSLLGVFPAVFHLSAQNNVSAVSWFRCYLHYNTDNLSTWKLLAKYSTGYWHRTLITRKASRNTDRQTDRQTHTHRQTHRQTDARQRDEIWTNKPMDGQTGGRVIRRIRREGGWRVSQTDRQTDRHTNLSR